MEEISFTDSSGVAWTVREDGADEARPLSGDAQPGANWLRFESELEVRRLWHYPDDWRGLNLVQLETLLERASIVVARFRSVRHLNRSAIVDAHPVPPPQPEALARPRRPDAVPPTRARQEPDDV